MITITMPEWMGWVISIGIWLHLLNVLLRWYSDYLRAKLKKMEANQ
jgi:hypothetical protein